ncbi:MAG: ATP-binding protein [Planctomycetota bacterium]
MTTRLVCLMSLLLLATLAVFGLLVQHSQDRIMAELERTVSTVGRGAIQSLDRVGRYELVAKKPRSVVTTFKRPEGANAKSTHSVAVVRYPKPGEDRDVETFWATNFEEAWEVVQDGRSLPPGLGSIASGIEKRIRQNDPSSWVPPCLEGESDDPTPMQLLLRPALEVEGEPLEGRLVSVSLADMKVVSDPGTLFLHIPFSERALPKVARPPRTTESLGSLMPKVATPEEMIPTGFGVPIRPSPSLKSGVSIYLSSSVSSSPPDFLGLEKVLEGDRASGPQHVAFHFEPVVGDESAQIIRSEGRSRDGDAAPEEVLLGVPVSTYEDIFSRMRQQSLMIFLGVLGLGVLLSVALANRFLKPVREMDVALARLSEGDWTTRVAIRGGHEMARLGTAFNRMTKRLQESREREAEMRRREKLSALGRLAAGVAHDVRNPLHSVNLTLQNLEDVCRPEVGPVQDEFDRTVSLMRGEIRRLDRLIENFLRFARSEPRGREVIRPETPVQEVARLLEKEAERRGVELVTVLDPERPPEIEADLESLRSAILNLVLNGFDAMPRGGTITLRLSATPDEVIYEVVDTGHGIPEDDFDRIFDFGYSTRETGTGLGLAMVHQVVVEEHAGRIQLESELGRGSRFRLRLPRSTAKKEVA